MVNFSLEGKVALVTGASYGIGFALATAYAQAGAKIVFNDIKQELVDKGLAAYKAEGIDAKGYVCDVTNEEQVNAMVAQIENIACREVMTAPFRSLMLSVIPLIREVRKSIPRSGACEKSASTRSQLSNATDEKRQSFRLPLRSWLCAKRTWFILLIARLI